MIDPKKLTEIDCGRWVIYKPHHAIDDPKQWERGKLKSWNDTNIFVVYACDDNWNRYWDYTGASTNPEDLEFEKI